MNGLPMLSDRLVLCLTIWGESRGEPVQGQIAVGCVVRNRLTTVASWKDICFAPHQFSCFNVDDPNYPMIQRAASMLLTQIPEPTLAQALWIADGVISRAAQDNTGGATHYLTKQLYDTFPPAWAKGVTPTREIGAHVFLRVA